MLFLIIIAWFGLRIFKNPSDLQNIKGFGPSIISNITKTKTTTNEKVVKKKVDTKIEAKKDLKIQEIQNKTK